MDSPSSVCRVEHHRFGRDGRFPQCAVALIGAVYVGVTIPMAIRAEEAFLRRTFGSTYDLYQRDEAPPMLRRFSLANARRNREYRAALGSSAGLRFLPRSFCCRYNRFFARVQARDG
jgi:hypothetical protein